MLLLVTLVSCSKDKESSTPVEDDDIIIGNQTWKQINLDVDHYRDGTPISKVSNQTQWKDLTLGAWCYYENKSSNGTIYGKLYNWYAVNDTEHGGLAPEGWHIPDDSDWETLATYLGGENIAGGKMKEVETVHWHAPNLDATNSSKFTGLPGGLRDGEGEFYDIGENGAWWSSSIVNESQGNFLYLNFSNGSLSKDYVGKEYGFSVRCVKD